MRKTLLSFCLAGFVAAVATAHAGHTHRVLGTVETIDQDHVVVRRQDGKEVEVRLTAKTKYERASRTATRQDLTNGARVVIDLEKDEKTAASVKIGGSPHR